MIRFWVFARAAVHRPVLTLKGATINMVLAFVFPGMLCLGLAKRGNLANRFIVSNIVSGYGLKKLGFFKVV